MVNDKENILIISYFFAPIGIVGSKRFSNLSYYLRNAGYNIFVLSSKVKYNPQTDESILFGGNITRASMIPPYYANANSAFRKILRRLWETFTPVDEYIGWVIPAILKGIKILSKNEINKIIVTGPPFSQFLVGFTLAKFFRKILIIDYQDPWFFYLPLHGIKKSALRYRINYWFEKKMLAEADRIVFNTSLAKQEYYKKFSFIKDIEKKSFVIENAFGLINGLEPDSLDKNKKVILYAGNFYGERKLSYLFEPIKQLNENGIIEKDSLKIHVFGKITEEDKDICEKYNFQNLVEEHSSVSTNEILKLMKGSDVLYLPQGNDVNYSVPYKFFDYLSVKKPILAVTPSGSATAQIVEETGSGETADITDSNSIYNALKKILCNNIGYSFKSEKYTWESISLKYIEVINSL